MYSTPLGSPTGSSKRSYVHAPRDRYQGEVVGVRVGTGQGGIGGWGPGGYTGRVIRDPPSWLKAEARQRSGPRKALQGPGVGGLAAACARAPYPTTPCGRARFAGYGPLPGQKAASGPIGRELVNISVKLVKRAKCHRNISKRPVIVPISKTGSRNHLLIFSDFHYLQPSLTRN